MNTPLQKKLENTFDIPQIIITILFIAIFVILTTEAISAQTNTVKIDSANAWEDLQSYLPEAKMSGTSVNVELLPPSECPPINPTGNYSEPYKLDFITWAKEIAKLSLRYSNFKGYGIENLQENLSLGYLNQAYIDSVKAAGEAINPKLQFISFEPKNYNLWYVDKNAKGNGDAASWTNAATSLSASTIWNNIAAGDTIYISGGIDSTIYGVTDLNNKNIIGKDVVIAKGWENGHNGTVWFVNTDPNKVHLFGFNNSSHIKLTRLNFLYSTNELDYSSTNQVILGDNGCSYITIDNCHIISNGKANGVVFWHNKGHISITNDTIETLKNNYPHDQDCINILSGGLGGHTIKGNTLIMRGTYTGTDGGHKDCIQIGSQDSPTNAVTTIADNFCYFDVWNNASIANSGIYVTNNGANQFEIYNNIVILRDNTTIKGIQVGNDSGTDGGYPNVGYNYSVKLFNNTILVQGDNTQTYTGIWVARSDSVWIYNNVISTLGIASGDPVPLTIAWVAPTARDLFECDYNYYYNDYNSTVTYYTGSGSNLSLSSWQALGYDKHGYEGAITFSSQWDSTITAYQTSQGRDLGTNLSSFFTTDILNTLRPVSSAWDMGAIEVK